MGTRRATRSSSSAGDSESRSPNKFQSSPPTSGAETRRASFAKHTSKTSIENGNSPSKIEPYQSTGAADAIAEVESDRRGSRRLTRGSSRIYEPLSSVLTFASSESTESNVRVTAVAAEPQQQKQTKQLQKQKHQQQGTNESQEYPEFTVLDRVKVFEKVPNLPPPIFVFGASENPNSPPNLPLQRRTLAANAPIQRGRGRPRKIASEAQSNLTPARQAAATSHKVQNGVRTFSANIAAALATTASGDSATNSSSTGKVKSSYSRTGMVSAAVSFHNKQQQLTPGRKAAAVSRRVKNNIFENYQGATSSTSEQNGASTPSYNAAVIAKRVTASKDPGGVSHVVERNVAAALAAEAARKISVRDKAVMFETATTPMKGWSSDEEQEDKEGNETENRNFAEESETPTPPSSDAIKAMAVLVSDVPKSFNYNYVQSNPSTKNLVAHEQQQQQPKGFSSPLRQSHVFEDFSSVSSSPTISPGKKNGTTLVASSSALTDTSDIALPFTSETNAPGSPTRKFTRVERPKSARKSKTSASTSTDFDETVAAAPSSLKPALKTPKKSSIAVAATYKSTNTQTMATTYKEEQREAAAAAAYGVPVMPPNPTFYFSDVVTSSTTAGKRTRNSGSRYNGSSASMKRGGEGSKKRFKISANSDEEEEEEEEEAETGVHEDPRRHKYVLKRRLVKNKTRVSAGDEEMEVDRTSASGKFSAKKNYVAIGNDEDEDEDDDEDNEEDDDDSLEKEKGNASAGNWMLGFVKGLVKPFLG
ncbi:hypothetical protein HK100_009310 [Physocladia obscura]|uniref:Uncharacterized protein n=1 Tax=Physocladia obscura TaxID=109957 RepID=A0AAD5T9D8_9FUNG|nr:hypothetical protein HK100_009310 [Physocladia obscura]